MRKQEQTTTRHSRKLHPTYVSLSHFKKSDYLQLAEIPRKIKVKNWPRL